jgi:branched-chain amino acid transport system permease protein
MLKKISLLAAIGVALILPQFFYPIFLMKVLCFALFACAFNLLIGFTGLLSFGHAAFFGGAGYFAGHFIKIYGFPPELGLLVGVIVAMGLGALIGGLAIRRQGIYFTMITLALAQMVYFIALQAPQTGGEDGLQSIPRGKLFGMINLSNDITLYYVILAIFILGFLFIWRIVNSPFGQVLVAIKENEPRAISLGYDVDRYKFIVFILSAGLSGLAGSMKVLLLGFATLSDVHWTMSGLVVLMTLVGGLGTLIGPVVGAAIIMILETKLDDVGRGLSKLTSVQWFSTLGDNVTIVTGLIFIVCVLLFRRGLVGELGAYIASKKRAN